MNATDMDYIDSRLETVSTRMVGEVTAPMPPRLPPSRQSAKPPH